jgi:hypothetical protein
MKNKPLSWVGVLLTLLCGCAAGTQSIDTARETNPDCSFRSPTTCWTMAGRFPSRSAEPPVDSLPDQPPVLASESDSTGTVP